MNNDFYTIKTDDKSNIVEVKLLERGAGKIKHLEEVVEYQREIIDTQRKTIETIKHINGLLTQPNHEKDIEIRGVKNFIKDIVNYSTADCSMNRIYIHISDWHTIIKKHTGHSK